ncbi:MAG: hypothetical protein O7149_01550 [Wolbachia endosymbiont of Hylaeus sinuatus]|nr:hypothetical protein [Wolbachia endosymbiont of Hylaeus sinuatus]
MMTSNNSSLLKDSQELTKTKGTIWKPLIAVSLLSVFSFTAGQYLPYVIIAVSGSGAIAAVPLAIFAVSAVVALISVTYLVKLAISRDDNKKEAGLNGQEFGHTASQEPQKSACKNCNNLENRSSVPTPTPPPVTLGTQPSPSPPLPPPPPPHCFTASKHTEQPKNGAPKKAGEPENDNDCSALLEQIRKGIELKATNTTQKNASLAKFTLPKGSNLAPVSQDDILQMRKKLKKPGAKEGQKQDGGDSNSTKIALILSRRPAIEYSDSESDDEDHTPDSEWEDKYSTTPTLQSDYRERRESLDSGHGPGSEPTSPSHPASEAGEPLISPKPVNSKTEAPLVNKESCVSSVNSEVKDPSTLPFNERMGKFGEKAWKSQFQGYIQGQGKKPLPLK